MVKAKTAMEKGRWEAKLAGSRSPWSLPHRLVILCFIPLGSMEDFISTKAAVVLNQKYGKALNVWSIRSFPAKTMSLSEEINQENEYTVILSSDHHSGLRFCLSRNNFFLRKMGWPFIHLAF